MMATPNGSVSKEGSVLDSLPKRSLGLSPKDHRHPALKNADILVLRLIQALIDYLTSIASDENVFQWLTSDSRPNHVSPSLSVVLR